MERLKKWINSFLTVAEMGEFLQFERPEQFKALHAVAYPVKEYHLIKATRRIDSLFSRGRRTLCLPVRFKYNIPFEILLAVALEACTSICKANNISVGTDLLSNAIQNGITSQSEKTASVTYDTSILKKYHSIGLDDMQAYKLIKPFLDGSGETKVLKIR